MEKIRDMNKIRRLFLEALKASISGEKIYWEDELSAEEWLALFRMAELHHVLPLIYGAVYECAAVKKLDPAFLVPFKKKMVQQVLIQTMKTNEFLQLEKYLQSAGIRLLVVKGIICRELYPNPDYRLSGDEDILIEPEQFSDCHTMMLSYGMHVLEPDQDIERVYEVPYGKQNSPLYIELHKSLFPPESSAYGDFNYLFEKVFDRAEMVNIQNVPVYTMEYTDHLFYLICHAFKHFLHSGFGIRQVCDITMFANAYGKEIDWLRLLEQCRSIHAEQFTAALFRIGKKYLTFSAREACYPAEWKNIRVDESTLLDDLLSGGVYGAANMSRQHSSNITLNAVSAHKQGRKTKGLILRTVFPPIRKLERRYPYLKKYPFLLPVAWGDRILKYRKETRIVEKNRIEDSIRIGNQRIELLKEYGIIGK